MQLTVRILIDGFKSFPTLDVDLDSSSSGILTVIGSGRVKPGSGSVIDNGSTSGSLKEKSERGPFQRFNERDKQTGTCIAMYTVGKIEGTHL